MSTTGHTAELQALHCPATLYMCEVSHRRKNLLEAQAIKKYSQGILMSLKKLACQQLRRAVSLY